MHLVNCEANWKGSSNKGSLILPWWGSMKLPDSLVSSCLMLIATCFPPLHPHPNAALAALTPSTPHLLLLPGNVPATISLLC